MEELLCTAQTLATDAACVEVLRRWRRRGIDPILLKGRTTAEWLYPADARGYTDTDLLVPPNQVAEAGAGLRELGFEPVGWHVSDHAHPWIRASDRATVDLHVTIWGPSRGAEWVWRELQLWTVPYRIGPERTRALSIPARALHVALHAAQHRDTPRNPGDLRRALDRTSFADWREAERLADRLRALVPMANGLALEPAGQELLERLPLARAAQALEYEDAPLAIGFARLADAPGLAAKARVFAHAIGSAPSETSRQRRSAPGYAARLLWLLARTPRTALVLMRARLRAAGTSRESGPRR